IILIIPYLEERKSLWAIAQPKFISPLPLGYALYTLEEGDFFRRYVKLEDFTPLFEVIFTHIQIKITFYNHIPHD
ncbi:hypothetical protein, partial [Terrihalobacillus insolitus]|uniref:hypothetical protein n=1 Tax=Terrihalobacillus insolitus TaxID=2950438 RepID=UPI00233FEE93